MEYEGWSHGYKEKRKGWSYFFPIQSVIPSAKKKSREKTRTWRGKNYEVGEFC